MEGVAGEGGRKRGREKLEGKMLQLEHWSGNKEEEMSCLEDWTEGNEGDGEGESNNVPECKPYSFPWSLCWALTLSLCVRSFLASIFCFLFLFRFRFSCATCIAPISCQ